MRKVSLLGIEATTWIIAALMVLAPVQPGQAHASLVKSTPANNTKLSKAPSEVRAWFSEKLAVKGSVIRLQDSHMKVIASGGVDTKVKTLDVMAVKAPMLSSGTYTVTWLAVSDDDGAMEKGSFKFTVGTAASRHIVVGRNAQSATTGAVAAPAGHAVFGNRDLSPVIDHAGAVCQAGVRIWKWV